METLTGSSALSAAKKILDKRLTFMMFAPIAIYLAYYLFSAVLDKGGSAAPLIAPATIVASWAANTLLGIGMTNFFLKAYDDPMSVSFETFWLPAPFWRYLGATVLTGLLFLAGLVLLLIPAVIVAVALAFVPYLIVDRPIGVIDSLAESARLTRGHRWKLFGIFVLFTLVNIAGLFALVVGLLYTMPLTMLATIHVFRTLEQEAGALVPAN